MEPPSEDSSPIFNESTTDTTASAPTQKVHWLIGGLALVGINAIVFTGLLLALHLAGVPIQVTAQDNSFALVRMEIATPTLTTTPTVAPTWTYTPYPTQTPEAATDTPTVTPTVTPLMVANRGANLRSGPGTIYDLVGFVQDGEALQPKGRNDVGDWIYLERNAWIAAFLVNNVPGTLSVVPTPPPPTPTYTPIPPTATYTPLPTSTPLPPTVTPTPRPGIGSDVRIDDLRWRVYQANDLGNRLKGDGFLFDDLTTSGRFILVSYEVHNEGNYAQTIWGFDLIDERGRRYESSSEAIWYMPSDQLCFLENLNPGVTKRCTMIFDVAPDAHNLSAKVEGQGLFFFDTIFISLGF